MSKKILIPLDGSELSEQALGETLSLTPAQRELVILHVNPAPLLGPAAWSSADLTAIRSQESTAARSYLHRRAQELRDEGHQVTAEVLEGDPADVILDYAEEQGIDLIVMTSRGRSGLGRFLLGSVADKVVRHAPCAVMVVGKRSWKSRD